MAGLVGGRQRGNWYLRQAEARGKAREKACRPPKPKVARKLLPREENQMRFNFMGDGK